jgi:hypothetical protein
MVEGKEGENLDELKECALFVQIHISRLPIMCVLFGILLIKITHSGIVPFIHIYSFYSILHVEPPSNSLEK